MDELTGLEEINDSDLAALYLEIAEEKPDESTARKTKPWLPSLTPKQMEVFFDVTPNLLLVSSRFTGKSWAAGYAAVKHAWDYHGALVMIIAKTKRQLLAGGLMEKLGADILPDFAANIEGFEYVGPKVTVEKDLIYQVTNKFGTKSVIQMMSVGNDMDLQKKIKGLEASLLIIDEVTLYETADIFTFLSGTLGRRSQIPSEMQRLIATTNPSDPEHWVAKYWDVLDESKRDPAFKVIQFFPADNPSEKVQAYYERLRQTLKNSPTQYARDIEGKWTAVISGDAIFADTFVREIHVRGDNITGEYLHPVAGSPIIVGMDVGDTNHGIVLLQQIPTKEKMVWAAFDEVVYVGKKVNLEQLTRDLMGKLEFWCETVDHSFSVNAISDRSAFDRFRATSGSYDHKEIERHYRENLSRYKRLMHPLKIIACPKPPGSVEARTRIVMDLLGREELYVSAKCVNLIDSLEHLMPAKDNPFCPGTHSPYRHAFDGLTYPMFYYKAGAAPQTTKTDELKSQLTRIGS